MVSCFIRMFSRGTVWCCLWRAVSVGHWLINRLIDEISMSLVPEYSNSGSVRHAESTGEFGSATSCVADGIYCKSSRYDGLRDRLVEVGDVHWTGVGPRSYCPGDNFDIFCKISRKLSRISSSFSLNHSFCTSHASAWFIWRIGRSINQLILINQSTSLHADDNARSSHGESHPNDARAPTTDCNEEERTIDVSKTK